MRDTNRFINGEKPWSNLPTGQTLYGAGIQYEMIEIKDRKDWLGPAIQTSQGIHLNVEYFHVSLWFELRVR